MKKTVFVSTLLYDDIIAIFLKILCLILNVRIRGDLSSPVQVGSDTMTARDRNDIY
jgi:hypothetical protein